MVRSRDGTTARGGEEEVMSCESEIRSQKSEVGEARSQMSSNSPLPSNTQATENKASRNDNERTTPRRNDGTKARGNNEEVMSNES